MAFHRSIVRRAGQPDLEQIWTTLISRMRPHFLDKQKDYPNLMDVYREHKQVVEVFRSGEVEAAALALQGNIS